MARPRLLLRSFLFPLIWIAGLLGATQNLRVVAFHPVFLQDMISLGLIPVAEHKTIDLVHFLNPQQLATITNLAMPTNPEQLAELHADLFIMPRLPSSELSLYRQLAQVVQIGGFSTAYDWRKRHLEVAAALGMLERGESALREYDRRAAEVRAELARRLTSEGSDGLCARRQDFGLRT